MPSLEGSNLRPSWRFRHALNRQKVTRGDRPTKKMLINDVGSRNVYENKQNRDEMPVEMSDIYVKVTRILQRNGDLEGQFAVNSIFETGFVRKFTATRTPRTPAGMGSFRPTCLRLRLALLRREALNHIIN